VKTPPRRRSKKKKSLRLQAAATASASLPRESAVVPKRWVKVVVALFLIPVALILTQAFFGSLTKSMKNDFWQTEEFWFFSLGVVLWLVLYFGLLRKFWLPLGIYIFGHECTHVLITWLMGGTVQEFRIHRTGGYVVTNRVNTWIALAPYFVPLYSIVAIMAFSGLSLFFEVWPYRIVLYAAIGATWAFHFCYTCIMIPKGQTDLAYGGSFFSLTIIYLMNLLILILLMILASPQVTWRGFGHEVVFYADRFLTQVHWLLNRIGP